eukprot:TRINITY_DN67277_c5_g3_i2.p1 TRINITY_DN67277_c5_g3~~TRINITY_DN67277_c5_g3_i2.p1  ORF type:complete len:327 (+),score=35.22 TRINITY_DN67277_c5_g3_i2:64-1044(+)
MTDKKTWETSSKADAKGKIWFGSMELLALTDTEPVLSWGEKFLSAFVKQFPERDLDLKALQANHEWNKIRWFSDTHDDGKDLDFSQVMLFHTTLFAVSQLHAKDIETVRKTARKIPTLVPVGSEENKQKVADLFANLPQDEDQLKHVTGLLRWTLNTPPKTNCYVYSVPDDEVVIMLEGFKVKDNVESEIEKFVNNCTERGAAGVDVCYYCSTSVLHKGPPLQQCSGCKQVLYCGPKCQKADWVFHREECKEMKSGALSHFVSRFNSLSRVGAEVATVQVSNSCKGIYDAYKVGLYVGLTGKGVPQPFPYGWTFFVEGTGGAAHQY